MLYQGAGLRLKTPMVPVAIISPYTILPGAVRSDSNRAGQGIHQYAIAHSIELIMDTPHITFTYTKAGVSD